MKNRYPWYEKMFYRLQIKERKYFRMIFLLMMLIFFVQLLLTIPKFRYLLVTTERLEGKEVRSFKSEIDR